LRPKNYTGESEIKIGAKVRKDSFKGIIGQTKELQGSKLRHSPSPSSENDLKEAGERKPKKPEEKMVSEKPHHCSFVVKWAKL
jgi:hypothetical protein